MPRTQSSRKDTRTPLEKLEKLESKVDRLIFFEYFEGFRSNGALGFDIHNQNVGSTDHWKKIPLLKSTLSKSQFRGKALKSASLAREFLDGDLTPPAGSKPIFTPEEIHRMLVNAAKVESPQEKLSKLAARMTELDWAIFFLYYDGFLTNGRIGFSPRETIGSVIHRSPWEGLFSELSEGQWHYRAVMYGNLAKEFVDAGATPPQNYRPLVPPRQVPHGIALEVIRGGF